MHHQHHVAGDEAHQKGDQHRHDQHHGPTALLPTAAGIHGVSQGSEEEDVGHYDDYGGDEEDQACHDHEVVEGMLHIQKGVLQVMDDVDVMAGGDVGVSECGRVVVEIEGCGAEPNKGPD